MSCTPGIKFRTCSFLLIMVAIWTFSLGLYNMCNISDGCESIFLIDGGYTGNVPLFNSCTANGSAKHCSFTFDTNQTGFHGCTFSKIGLWLLKNKNYQIYLTRDTPRPKSPIYFLPNVCTNNTDYRFTDLQDNISELTCNEFYKVPRNNGSCNVTCLDPKDFCKHAQYTTCKDLNITKDNNENYDVITLNDSGLVCHKCGSALEKTEEHLDFSFKIIPGDNKTTNMNAVMMNLTSTILELMNKSTVSVTLGEVHGVFVKPKTPQSPDTVSFAYSNVTNLSIVQDETQLVNFPRTVSVPKEAFQKALNQTGSNKLFVAVFRFPNFSQDEKNSIVLENEVYSIEMGAEIANLTDTINLTFKNVDPKDGVPSCHSWNGEGFQPNWTSEGCHTITENDSVTCECQHLTFFALLMAPNQDYISSSDLNILTYITSIGCGLSLFFLCVALFMHFLLRQATASYSVHILINLFVALSLLNLTFLTNENVATTQSQIGCKLMAGLMHYCLLASFMWFGLVALHLCLQLAKNPVAIKHYLTKVCIAGWVPPAITVAVLFCCGKYNILVLRTDTEKETRMCWITDSMTEYIVNIGFYSVIFILTLMTFTFMLRWLFLVRKMHATQLRGNADLGQSRPTGTSDALTVMGLCSMLGLTWGFAFFAYGPLRLPAYYIFTVLNSFQGVFLFIYYYNSSKPMGEAETQSGMTKSTKESTSTVENPYEKHFKPS